ncbi:hypothetical protein A9Z42_0051130 [Trichoderma parareesei]|uniref:Uncharacterized protein n=1 Tax=Trichoderma parareesei TaxID=858221 RepID=A0A2H2ZB78_TRIPA|nr:hypothetical protein A9Z42_0051130 [Trichoderma parareesei]
MPTYLCHGFRWTRRLIRIFVIIEDLDDAAPDWITGRNSSAAILERFGTKFDYLPQRLPQQQAETPSEQASVPQQQKQATQDEKIAAHQDDDFSVPPSRVPYSEDSVLVNQFSPVKLLEEYDPEETSISARPFAYVADHVIRIDLSANVLEEMAKYEALVKERNEGNWFERLRDELQPGSPIEWYVVVNGDEERGWPHDDEEESEGSDVTEMEDLKVAEEEDGPRREQPTGASSQMLSPNSQHAPNKPADQTHSLRHKISRAGLRRLFSKKEAPE